MSPDSPDSIEGTALNRWTKKEIKEDEGGSRYQEGTVKVNIDKNIPEEKAIRDGVREYLKTVSRNIFSEFPELQTVNEFDKQWADLLLPFKQE